MFPMRDHLYELATAHELELMKTAQYEQQLQEAQRVSHPVWWPELFRSLWKKLARVYGKRQHERQSPATATMYSCGREIVKPV
jgi:hypothetical protein